MPRDPKPDTTRAACRSTERCAPGVQLRHQRSCPRRSGAACTCTPTYQAQVWSARDQKPIRRTFTVLADAKAWRQEAHVALRRGRLRAPSKQTLHEAAQEWLTDARAGVARTRSGDRYKPSAVRTYRIALRAHILPRFGHLRVTALTRHHIQELVDDLVSRGAAPSTVRNAILPLRAIYRREHHRDVVAENPTRRLLLPAVRSTRDRVARPAEAAALINALPAADQALWATALYAGLRRGELQALRWRDIDLDQNLIHVNQSWDRVEGPIEPKSRAGRRRVPLTQTLRRYLITHRLYHPHTEPDDLAFGTHTRPFEPTATLRRARTAWRLAGHTPILLHESRHTYAAHMIAAGINPKALQTYMGHASITITLDRYGHLLPGNETHAANLHDAYLAPNATTTAAEF
jgi:integrase